jgi:hypothetical protein
MKHSSLEMIQTITKARNFRKNYQFLDNFVFFKKSISINTIKIANYTEGITSKIKEP